MVIFQFTMSVITRGYPVSMIITAEKRLNPKQIILQTLPHKVCISKGFMIVGFIAIPKSE